MLHYEIWLLLNSSVNYVTRLRKQLFTTREIASSRVLKSFAGSTGEFHCEYWRVLLRVLRRRDLSRMCEGHYLCFSHSREYDACAWLSGTRETLALVCKLAAEQHSSLSLVYARLQLATSDFQAEFMSRWLYIATYLGNGRFHIAGIRQASRCTTASFVPLNWSCKGE